MRVNYSKDKDLFGFKYAFYKHTRLSVLEKIKNQKKIFTKKSRIDSVVAVRLNRDTPIAAIILLQYKRKTDVSRLYCKPWPPRHARIIVKRRFYAFGAPCALLFARAVCCAIVEKHALKTVIRGARRGVKT